MDSSHSPAASQDTPATGTTPTAGGARKGAAFWLIIASLLLSTFLAALDLTAVSTALPTIAAALKSEEFAWIGNSYTCVLVPFAGGLAHAFGRRPILLGALIWFFVGSALCGAAKDMTTMLIGRAFQGVGAGGILTLVEIVLADLVPLSERGAYQGAFGAVWALASATGPIIGGALASAGRNGWTWLFYLNLPLTAVCFIIVAVCLRLKQPEGSIREKLGKMDWLGSAIFIPSTTILIIALCWGGVEYSWKSAQVLTLLIVGAIGFVLWFVVEKSYVAHPTVPFALLGNWTTSIGFATTLLHGISALCLFYFWPVYFQAVKGVSPVRSAVAFFSVAFIVAPCAMIAGASIGILQRYKPQNIIAWIFMTVGPGILSLVSAESPTSAWAALPIPFSIGVGLLYAATTFPVLAPLPPALAGKALAFLVFVRSFGNIIGITIGSVVLNNELASRAPEEWLSTLPGGVSSAYSAIPSISNLAEPLRSEVREAFARALRMVWLVLIPFGGVGLILALFMREIPLQTVTDESWGIKERGQRSDAEKSLNEPTSPTSASAQ